MFYLSSRGSRSNEIPPTLGQLKEHVGFLVSRSLTLPAAPPDEPQALFQDVPCTQKKKNSLLMDCLRPEKKWRGVCQSPLTKTALCPLLPYAGGAGFVLVFIAPPA